MMAFALSILTIVLVCLTSSAFGQTQPPPEEVMIAIVRSTHAFRIRANVISFQAEASGFSVVQATSTMATKSPTAASTAKRPTDIGVTVGLDATDTVLFMSSTPGEVALFPFLKLISPRGHAHCTSTTILKQVQTTTVASWTYVKRL